MKWVTTSWTYSTVLYVQEIQGAVIQPFLGIFCPLLNISLGNQYLEILDLRLIVVDALLKNLII